ncbi:hypothetical protein EIN_387400, partial [Entamoeba invadens IP1]
MPPKKKSSLIGKSLKRSNARDRRERREKEFEGKSQMEGINVNGTSGGMSVTESCDLQELVDKVAATNTAFAVEKQYNVVYNKKAVTTVTEKSNEELEQIRSTYALVVPRRAIWKSEMSAHEVDQNEQKEFMDWKKKLYELQNETKLLLTPYEKNIEFWRQLWRTCEQSDLVLQIVDGRDPLFYYSRDLVKYIKELGTKKAGILVNKADLLTENQRRLWLKYFDENGIRVLFYSALKENKEIEGKEEKRMRRRKKQGDFMDETESDHVNEKIEKKENESDEIAMAEQKEIKSEKIEGKQQEKEEDKNSKKDEKITSDNLQHGHTVLTAVELIAELTRLVADIPKNEKNLRKVIGFCGFPNVGKSSTINSLIGVKKVGVTSTPGKTKHFQTIILNDEMMLCDCPGLVFPSFLSSKEEMICSGVLSIDRMQDCIGPMDLVTRRISPTILEKFYKFTMPKPEDFLGDFIDCFESRTPSLAELFLAGFAKSRRYYTNTRGLLDYHKVARIVLKDYCCGKLVYCKPPPGTSDEVFEAARINTSN